MSCVWKFHLALQDEQYIVMPEHARILCVQTQDAAPCLWATVSPEGRLVGRLVYVHGTGHLLRNAAAIYIGTFQLSDGGALVFHVFDGGEVA